MPQGLAAITAPGGPEWILFVLFPVVVIGLAVYAAKDMNRRGKQGVLYALLILVAPPVGILVWLILRSQNETQDASPTGTQR